MNPFEVLGLAPTMDVAEIKRAYFCALGMHPPHSDPDGFRHLRAAYELLRDRWCLAATYWATGFDARSEFERYCALDANISQVVAEECSVAQRTQGFVESISRLSYEDAIRDSLETKLQ